MKTIPILLALLVLTGPQNSRAGESVIECGNLIYAGTKTSVCFSDEFLSAAQRQTTIATERRIKPVKLGSDELFKFPFVVMTGEDEFTFTAKERENLKTYLESGGFLLASAGCSNEAWDKSFRREIARIFPDTPLGRMEMDHPLFRTVNKIESFRFKAGSGNGFLEGLTLNGKTVCVYSAEGLNDTAHTSGCCCCGGNEILNSLEVNVNIFAYALLH